MKILCTFLRGCWCDITVLNMHASTEDGSHHTMNSDEVGCVFSQFIKYPHDNFVGRRFKFKSGERRYFQTNN